MANENGVSRPATPAQTPGEKPPRDPHFISRSSDLLEAMANPSRLHMLTLLMEEEISVGELALRIGLTQSALSQHLAKLRANDLVTTRRRGQMVYYTCNSVAVTQVLAILQDFFTD